MATVEESGMPLLILMPKGREAALAIKALSRSGIHTEICEQSNDLDKHISDRTGAVLLTEEMLTGRRISRFRKNLRTQPPWSDLPLVILTSGSETDKAHYRILNLFGPNANVTFIARPLRALTLISAVQAALRARRHQFAMYKLWRNGKPFWPASAMHFLLWITPGVTPTSTRRWPCGPGCPLKK